MWENGLATACVESAPLAWSQRTLALEARLLRMAWVQQPLFMGPTAFPWIPLGTCTLAIMIIIVSARFFLLVLCRRSQEAALLAALTASEQTRNFPTLQISPSMQAE
jgi:hypothetical protein